MITSFIASIGLANLLAGPAIGLIISAIRIFSAGKTAVEIGKAVASVVPASAPTVVQTAVAPRETPVQTVPPAPAPVPVAAPPAK